MKKYLYLLFLLLLIPTAVSASVGLTAFFTQAGNDSILIVWETESETQNSGYNVYRTTENVPDFAQIVDMVRVNDRPIAPLGELGGRYELVDDDATPNITYYYWLEDIDTNGNRAQNGPALGRIEQGSAINPPTATPNPTTPSTSTTTTPTVAATPTTDGDTTSATPTPPAIAPTSTATEQQPPTSSSADATVTPVATATDQGRVFITPSTTSGDAATTAPSATEPPTQNNPTPQSTPVIGGQSDGVFTATPQPINEGGNPVATSDAVVVNPTTAVVVQPTTAANDGVEDQPDDTTAAGTDDETPAVIGESAENDTQPPDDTTVDSTAVDGTTANPAESDVTLNATEVVIADLVGDPAEVDPNAIGGDAVTDVQQPSIVQPQANDENGMFLWLGLVAGGLLILVGAGFALLFLGNRKT